MTMTSRQTRESFLRFFEKRGHRLVRSSSLIPAGDPTLLFTNAGMNQFKNVFTGAETREYKRAASSQKCLRVSGKHNDLEQVGRTSRHHTFFEMLGNFSFGDYFKDEAIAFAWELLTRDMALPKERLWLTVFEGSDAFGPDVEAEEIWKRQPGVRPERILRYGEKDNFWRMGETGPCGPCSEIHWDHGPGVGCGRVECDPSCECDRFVELWNLVFMQFEQKPDGTVIPLPAPSIDTGMGLERIAAVQQGVTSNYDTDLFLPILDEVAASAGIEYRPGPPEDGPGHGAGAIPGTTPGERRGDDPNVSLRVISDHLRAATFLVADGVVPSNDKQGYVLRRILRRAIRHGQRLGIQEPFLHRHMKTVVDLMGSSYPELIESADVARALILREEEQFARTLSIGVSELEKMIAETEAGGAPRERQGTEGSSPGGAVAPSSGAGARSLSGERAFRLYDTFGLPLDLTEDIAAERGFTVDRTGFDREMEAQRERARRSWQTGAEGGKTPKAVSLLVGAADLARSTFAGYERTRTDGSEVLAISAEAPGGTPPERRDRLGPGERGTVVLDRTPFYAEAGGQVGDTGFLEGPDGNAEVLDTRAIAPGVHGHSVRMLEGSLAVGQRVIAEVDARRRRATMRNHTATHLLHAALRELVGTHVKQAGSLVAPDRLRFDFSHFQGLDEGALREIEDLVNEKILEDIELTSEVMPIDDAIRAGAMALFGEKYGERVRVIRVGEFSVELCGGTHTARTGEIGLFRLLGERGVSSGVRRVEALTGEASLRKVQQESDLLRRVEQAVGVARPELVEGLEKRLSHGRSLQKEVARLRMKLAQEGPPEAEGESAEVNGARIVGRRVDGVSQSEMRSLADSLKQRIRSGVVILGRAEEEKVSLLVAVTEDLLQRVHAGRLVKSLAELVGGGGGGRADMAEAGGKNPEKLDDAIRAGVAAAKASLSKTV